MGNIHKNRAKLIPGMLFMTVGTVMLVLGISQGVIKLLVGGLLHISVGYLFVKSYSKTKSKIEKVKKEIIDKEFKGIKDRENEVQTQIKKVKKIQGQINNVSKILIPSISDFKSFVIKNETVIPNTK